MPVNTKLYGYCDRFDYEPGATVQVMLHSEFPDVRVDVVRLRGADERVTTVSPLEERVDSIQAVTIPGRIQNTYAGSYGIVEDVHELEGAVGARIRVWIYPTLLNARHDQGVISWLGADRCAGVALVLAPDGHLELRVGTQSGMAVACRGEMPLLERTWTLVECRISIADGIASLRHAPGKALPRSLGSSAIQVPLVPGVVMAVTTPRLLFAAENLETDDEGRCYAVGSFNGKIEGPSLAVSLVAGAGEVLVAQWDFSLSMADDQVIDQSGNGHDGRVVHAPTRAVTSHGWGGDEVDWRKVPDQYAAIHFHEDDLEDAGWPPSLEISLPTDLESGFYAIRATGGDGEDRVPFVVLPRRDGSERPAVAFLSSTWTYQAYANACLIKRIDYRGLGLSERDYQFGPRDDQIDHSGVLACSLYDLFRDGSGRCYSTLRRPVFTFRPDYRSCVQGAPRHLGADFYITGWLETNRHRFDVVSDHLLDTAGHEAIADYRVLITSSHPEYVSARMLQALEQYLDAGGSIMYLGGNGFYWVTSQDLARPYLIECRRGNAGTRTWDSPPGETHHSSTGEPGGLWRYRGRAPNALVGVGMASQGWDFKAPGFRRTPASFQPDVSWIFDGIAPEAVIGDVGLVMDGGSGDELDRFDTQLGSPPHGVVVATSLPHSKYYKLVVEDVPMTTDHLGGDENPKVRSDITYFDTASGGGVFSVGSITWAGAMAFNDFDNPAARLTTNVLNHFLRTSEAQASGS